jgi:hypothetical protein
MDKRYQRANHNLYIKEEETTQWTNDTKGPIRICISKKKRQHNGQKIPKGPIRIRISKKKRQHNGQMIPKGQSESVYQRRRDNTMDK